MSLREKLLPMYRAMVLQALNESGCDQTLAAKELGIHRNTLSRLVRDCEINIEQLKKNFASARLIAEQKAENLNEESTTRAAAPRYRLPGNRVGITHRFEVASIRCYLTVNCYTDGAPGEMFLKIGKIGEAEHGWTDAFSIAFSMLLQQGTPLRELIDKFSRTRFEPAGVTSGSEIKFATSVLDYAMRWMELRFLREVPQ